MIPCDKTCLEKYLLLEPLFRIHNVRNILRINSSGMEKESLRNITIFVILIIFTSYLSVQWVIACLRV